MCGLVAMLPGDGEVVGRGLATMRDRGPDAQIQASLGGAIIGVARLSITDPAHGRQPMLRGGGRFLVGFNGAIYNWRQLAERNGFALPTGNDGEIIAPLYERYGLAFADHLEGMFAIAIYDRDSGQLISAQDRFGVKPLYVARFDGCTMLASTLACFPDAARAQVRRHLPGFVETSDGVRRRIAERAAPEGVRLLDLLRASVREQIPAEVGWGCLLSGGVDSSLIAALAREASAAPVATISCGVAGSEDRAMAARLAGEMGFAHTDIEIAPAELRAAVPEVVRVTASYDPAIVMNGLGVYFAARAAHRAGLRVVLAGDGADELFGGYAEYEAAPADVLKAHLAFDQQHLGASEFLRLDRCSMAWSVEARVPYLARDVVAAARALAPADLVSHAADPPVRKAALRAAAQQMLPDWVALRGKVRLCEGQGLPPLLFAMAQEEAPDAPVPYLPAEIASFPGSERLTAWLKRLWDQDYRGYEDDWIALQQRGLVRRQFNPYLPL